MNRHHTIIAALLATAGLFGAALVFMPSTTSTAYGETQVTNGQYVLMTARAVENGDDSVVVLENRTGKMLTYQFHTDAGGAGRLLLTNPVDLTKMLKAR